MNLTDEVRAGMVLNRLEGLGPIRMYQLIRHFGSALKTVTAGASEWAAQLGDASLCERLMAEVSSLVEKVNREWDQCERLRVKVLSFTTGPYPELLRQIHVPPLILFVKGPARIEDLDCFAIVGSRRSSYYGSKMARQLARDLSEAGLATVSGLARGIDSAVHEETLIAKGTTLAVIGSGLDLCYPPENRKLFDRISAEGAVISEFPFGMQPMPGNFPRRNRIISGLSHATVVVEGTLKSGSLITAKIAASEGREVGAVPGPVSSVLSQASHLLIREGAALIRDSKDALELLPEPVRDRLRLTNMSSMVEKAVPGIIGEVLRHLESEGLSREELLERLSVPVDEGSELLVRLELEGQIKTIPGGLLVRV